MRAISLLLMKILEAEPGIEPRSTALQADDVSFFIFHINRLLGKINLDFIIFPVCRHSNVPRNYEIADPRHSFGFSNGSPITGGKSQLLVGFIMDSTD